MRSVDRDRGSPSSSARPRLVFHIGLEKTGTTSLQHFCADNTALLLRHGLLYPTRNRGFGLYNHANLAAAYLDDRPRDFTLTTARVSRPEVVASLLAEIRRSEAPTVLLSSEHLSSRFDAAKAALLAGDFAGFEARVAVTLRNHEARFFSSYSTYVCGGGVMDLDAYAQHMLRPDDPYFRIGDTVARWRAAFGPGSIDLFDVDAQPDIVPVVLGAYAATPLPAGLRRPYRDKPSVSPAAAEAMRLTNRAVAERQGEGRRGSYAAWLQRRYFQRGIARALAAGPPAAPEPWRLGGPMRRRLRAIAEADRRWLAQECGFTLAVTGAAPLDDPPEVPSPDTAAAERLARALVRASTRGRWAISTALVSIFAAVERWRGRG